MTWIKAAAANGAMMAGKDLSVGSPTWPPKARKARPARYALSAYIDVLKTRCRRLGPRRRPNAVQAPTMAAPTGPTRTTEASMAAELDDQVSCPLRSCVALDSETITRIPRKTTYCHFRPVNGPLATSAAAATTTAPM